MQKLKNTVRLSIEQSALLLFSTKGYDNTTMAEIAAHARISTGNIYHYHANKEALLYSIITDSFVESCLQIISDKIQAVNGMNSDEIGSSKSFRLNNARLLKFLCENRLKLLILLRGCNQTRWVSFRSQITQTAFNNALEYFASIHKIGLTKSKKPDTVLLASIYDNLINSTIAILAADSDENSRKSSLKGLIAYHLNGMKALV